MRAWWLAALGLFLLSGGFALYRISQHGVDRIKTHEEWRDTVYEDEAGYPTIGWGHKLRPGESFPGPITEAQGEQLLRADLAEAEAAINRLVTVPLDQNQYDALVSFVFNVGVGAFASSTLLRLLNAGNYAGAADELLRWKYVTQGAQKVVSNGLLIRRERERELFLS